MTHEVVLIPGDGIGPEVAAATRLVLDATGVDLGWEQRPAGAPALGPDGALLPGGALEPGRGGRTAMEGPASRGRLQRAFGEQGAVGLERRSALLPEGTLEAVR